MFQFFNPNPAGRNVGDCVIRAVCKATGQTWEKSYTDLCLQGFMMLDMPSSNAVWGAYLRGQGFKRYVIPNTCPDCYTIGQFAADHPQGLFVVATGTHVVTVDSGTIFDTWDSSNEVPIYYFTKEGS